MNAENQDLRLARRANELYWDSDESVNQIAERLELSKSALYDLVGPLTSGSACPICGAEADFPNRTARQRDRLVCPVCEWEGSELETEPVRGGPGEERDRPRAPGTRDGVPLPPRTALIAGALIGAAAGLAWIVVLGRRGS